MRDEIQLKINNAHPTQVDLNGMTIRDGELKEIIRDIKQQRPDVREIFFQKNKIGDAGAIILAQELEAFAHLTYVDLQFNQIDVSGLEAMFHFKNNHLDFNMALHGNKVTDAGILDEIAQAASGISRGP